MRANRNPFRESEVPFSASKHHRQSGESGSSRATRAGVNAVMYAAELIAFLGRLAEETVSRTHPQPMASARQTRVTCIVVLFILIWIVVGFLFQAMPLALLSWCLPPSFLSLVSRGGGLVYLNR